MVVVVVVEKINTCKIKIARRFAPSRKASGERRAEEEAAAATPLSRWTHHTTPPPVRPSVSQFVHLSVRPLIYLSSAIITKKRNILSKAFL